MNACYSATVRQAITMRVMVLAYLWASAPKGITTVVMVPASPLVLVPKATTTVAIRFVCWKTGVAWVTMTMALVFASPLVARTASIMVVMGRVRRVITTMAQAYVLLPVVLTVITMAVLAVVYLTVFVNRVTITAGMALV